MAVYKDVEQIKEFLKISCKNEILLKQMCDIIDGFRIADVEEVRHGEWINKNGIYVCSECDFTCPYDVIGDNIEYWECLYCPHCGTRMDGGNK